MLVKPVTQPQKRPRGASAFVAFGGVALRSSTMRRMAKASEITPTASVTAASDTRAASR